ncbi:hypothetical protein PPACK8108_LOCUS20363 [Phakopsora pachyrhizi]|uniref:Uncharacterized protein n=1 Tax=Phakopsora pachyrhizi TaxID=170000 RepID=A0AAV0BG85_PHAPC|nr:hypothetical protein PPACK8108_LOCUS20363 [Phakopsora pachyrhizi]
MSAFFIDTLNFQTYHVRMTMKLINKHGKERLNHIIDFNATHTILNFRFTELLKNDNKDS